MLSVKEETTDSWKGNTINAGAGQCTGIGDLFPVHIVCSHLFTDWIKKFKRNNFVQGYATLYYAQPSHHVLQ